MTSLTEEQIAEIQENFDYFDTDKNGQIDYKEFTLLIDALGGDMTTEKMQAGFDIVDSDHNGSIDIEEFMDWWGEQ
ncbi:MAG: EF-hand domain-containing protein [Gammaproteobacteria bacterium]|nr:EF-hand domain-containing protein [Gammaproteobacteria bacterium]